MRPASHTTPWHSYCSHGGGGGRGEGEGQVTEEQTLGSTPVLVNTEDRFLEQTG